MERFLTDVLEIDHQDAHDQACAVEHSISEDAANKMCRIMGTRIDEDCGTCQNPCHTTTDICVKASDMKQGDRGKISHLSSDDGTVIRKLISMGFVPGREIELSSAVSDKGARILKIGDTVIALDRDMASAVYVTTE